MNKGSTNGHAKETGIHSFNLNIRFGNKEHEIPTHQITYFYETEGFIILCTTEKYRYPISGMSIDSIMEMLSGRQFFKLTHRLIVNRDFVTYCDEELNYVATKLNQDFNNVVPANPETIYQFQRWLCTA